MEIDMKSLVTKAMYDSLDQKVRDKLIQEALEHLIAPTPSGRIGIQGPSVLEEAFRTAVAMEAHTFVQEEVKNNPAIKQMIHEIVLTAFDKFYASDKIVDRLVEAMWRLFDHDR